MLPFNILASCGLTDIHLDGFKTVLDEYATNARCEHIETGGLAFSWVERTLMNFGGSEWAATEDSLVLENRRAVVCKSDPENEAQSFLIFLALIPSSLINLRNSVSQLISRHLNQQVREVGFALGRLARENVESNRLVGAEMISLDGERVTVSRSVQQEINPDLVAYFSKDYIPSFTQSANGYYLSELYLRFASHGDVALSRGGSLTFNDPDLSLTDIMEVVSQITSYAHVIEQPDMQIVQFEETERATEESQYFEKE